MRRYDLLCIEGIARALRIFLGKDKPPQYKLKYPEGGEEALISATIAPEVGLTYEVARVKKALKDMCRPSKYGPTLPVLYCAMSSSPNAPMSPSSIYKTSCTRISVDVASLSPSGHTIWTRSSLPSRTKPCRQRRSNSLR